MAKGPDEADLVNSGLEETMISAFHELRADQARASAASPTCASRRS